MAVRFLPRTISDRMSVKMALSDSPFDAEQLAAVRADLDHDLGYAVLCQSPEAAYTVLEFAGIALADAATVDDAQYTDAGVTDVDLDTGLAVDVLDGVVAVYAVSETETAARYAVDGRVGEQRFPLRQLDEDLSGPGSPGSTGGLWTAGTTENYPLYEVRRVDEDTFEVAP